jgi:hypothetical protein
MFKEIIIPKKNICRVLLGAISNKRVVDDELFNGISHFVKLVF